MAVNQISTSVSIINSLKGFYALNLDSMGTTSVPTVLSGSVLEIASAFFSWGTAETPNASSWTAIATGSTVYMQCTPSGTAGSQIVTTSYTTASPTWVGSKSGWYASAASNVRVVAGLTKGGASLYGGKTLLTNEAMVNTGALGRLGLGTNDVEAWDADIHAVLESKQEALAFGSKSDTPQILALVNSYQNISGTDKAKITGAGSQLRITNALLAFETAVSASADADQTLIRDFSVVGDGGTTTTMNLGGAAGGSARNATIGLASDATMDWEESSGLLHITIGGVADACQFGDQAVRPSTSTTAAAANVYQSGSLSNLVRSTSSLRYKQDVATIIDDSLIDMLRPIIFRSKCEGDDQTIYRYGFGAEDVHALGSPGLVHYIEETEPDLETYTDAKGTERTRIVQKPTGRGSIPDGVQYQSIIPLLVVRVQKLTATVASMELRLSALEAKA